MKFKVELNAVQLAILHSLASGHTNADDFYEEMGEIPAILENAELVPEQEPEKISSAESASWKLKDKVLGLMSLALDAKMFGIDVFVQYMPHISFLEVSVFPDGWKDCGENESMEEYRKSYRNYRVCLDFKDAEDSIGAISDEILSLMDLPF